MNNINDLRATLADIIKGVRSGEIDIDKAKTINELSKSIIDTARLEVDYAKHTGSAAGEFIAPLGSPQPPAQIPGRPAGSVIERNGNVTRHRLT